MARKIVMPVCRQWHVAALILGVILLVSILGMLLLPKQYQSDASILVFRDPPALAGLASANHSLTADQRDLNSEAELLTSSGVIEPVARERHLEGQELRDDLSVRPEAEAGRISVSYTWRDPREASAILRSLIKAYLEKRTSIDPQSATSKSLDRQIRLVGDQVTGAEKSLVDFEKGYGWGAAAKLQNATQQINQLEAEIEKDKIATSEAAARASSLQLELSAVPEQEVETQTLDNERLLAQFESTLLSLRLQRIDMLEKYDPAYPPVGAVEQQIAQVEWTIAQTEQSPLKQVSTIRSPARDAIVAEVARANADRVAFEAASATALGVVGRYREVLRRTTASGEKEESLMRQKTVAEDDYRLYVQEREALRGAETENPNVSVSVAEAPSTPALPVARTGKWLLATLLLALATSFLGAHAADRLSPVFHTPEELAEFLDINVLASIPKSA